MKILSRLLAGLLIVACFLAVLGAPSNPVSIRTKVSKNGQALFQLKASSKLNPLCISKLEFSKDKKFSAAIYPFTIGHTNFSKAAINFKLPGTPFDSETKQIKELFVRFIVDCSETEKAQRISSSTQTLDLSKLSAKVKTNEDKFMQALVGKTLSTAVRKSRAKFQSSLSAVSAVKQAPKINFDLVSRTVKPKQDIILRVGALGSKPVKYDWYLSSPDGGSSKKIKKTLAIEIANDPLGSSLIVRASLIDTLNFNAHNFKVKAYNKHGSETSSSVQVFVANSVPATPVSLVPTATITTIATATNIATATATAINTATATRTSTATATAINTATATRTSTAAATATSTATATATATRTSTPTNTRTSTPSPTPTTSTNCTGSATRSCSIPNGNNGSWSQTRYCLDGSWSDYGACTVESCNPGYQISGNNCVLSNINDSSSYHRLTADFIPQRPFVFINNQEINIMRDNILNKKYAWATQIYNEALKECNDTQVVYRAPSPTVMNLMNLTTLVGRPMMACALVYLVDPSDNTTQGKKAVEWLHVHAHNNFLPSAGMVGTYLSSGHIAFGATYDMMYNYMSASDPGKLTKITEWLEDYAERLTTHMQTNQNLIAATGRGFIGYTLGKASLINAAMDGLIALAETGDMPYGFYNDKTSDACAQASKNFNNTIQAIMYYGIASHRSKLLGHHNFDALYHKNSKGYNLIDGNFRTLLKMSTPNYQIPFFPISTTFVYYLPTDIGVQHSLYALTGDPDWGALAREGYRIINKHSWYSVYWDGLAHGRQVPANIKPRNSSFFQEVPGFAALASGPANGPMEKTANHVTIMHGSYGISPSMNLFLSGKGKMLTSAGDFRYNNWPQQSDTTGIGGYRLRSTNVDQGCSLNSTPLSEKLLWDISKNEVKFAAFKSNKSGLSRSLAVTDDYTIDLFYDLPPLSNNDLLAIDGIGPNSTFATINGTNKTLTSSYQTIGATPFSVTWPQHMKIHFLPTTNTLANVASYGDLPHQTDLQKKLLDEGKITAVGYVFNSPFSTELVRRVQIREDNATSMFSVIEPIATGSVIHSISRLGDPALKNKYNAVKINTNTYTDYYVYEQQIGSYNINSGNEYLNTNNSSQHGWIRYNHSTGQVVVYGAISTFKINAPNANQLIVNGVNRTFSRSGDFAILN